MGGLVQRAVQRCAELIALEEGAAVAAHSPGAGSRGVPFDLTMDCRREPLPRRPAPAAV